MKSLLVLFLIFVTHCRRVCSYCPPLVAPKTTELACVEPLKQQRVNCSASWLPEGAVAYFRCEREFQRRAKGKIKCSENGIHRHIGNTKKSFSDDQLPCGIKKDVQKPDVHIYGYKEPVHYELSSEANPDIQLHGEALHNKFRRSHGSPPLRLQTNLSRLAQDWADQISKTGRLDMAPNLSYGQNVFLTRANNNLTIAVNDAVQNWYFNGRSEYCWEDVTENWGDSLSLDFSQLVWKNSKFLGIGAATLKSGKGTAVVAFYDPPGNTVIDGDEQSSEYLFELNVLPLQVN